MMKGGGSVETVSHKSNPSSIPQGYVEIITLVDWVF
jgi:hypothetical protein